MFAVRILLVKKIINVRCVHKEGKMANCCFVEIECNDSDYWKRLQGRINEHKSIHLIENKYLFDADLNEDYITGWVKWSISTDEIIALIKAENFKTFKCYYDEPAELLYGYYEFKNNVLKEVLIPQENPIWETEYDGAEIDELLKKQKSKILWSKGGSNARV